MSASFKDLRVWQEAMKFAVEVYRVTAQFPRHELYGLSQQLRRAAVSVPSNTAEGKGHTQVMIAEELQYVGSEETQRILASADAIGRSLNSLINSLREKAA